VFATMFETSGFTESDQARVTIDDMCFEALRIFVKFIYTGRLVEDWINYTEEIVNAAEKYNLPIIKSMGDKDLIKNCTPQNAKDLLEFARVHELGAAVSDIKNFIEKYVLYSIPLYEQSQIVHFLNYLTYLLLYML
jgi:hypothetical protein